MKCPLCESRKAKRLCPAKATHICSVCCGTKREVEIDCPSDCVYLHMGREYESERRARTEPVQGRTGRLWSDRFLQQYHRVMMGASQVISQTRHNLPELVDSDVQAVLDSLIQTFTTLDKGIYYDSAPGSLRQRELYFALKLFFEQPEEKRMIDETRLTTSEILDCLQFLKELSTAIILPRPKSRAFLDHLEGLVPDSAAASRGTPTLIVPG